MATNKQVILELLDSIYSIAGKIKERDDAEGIYHMANACNSMAEAAQRLIATIPGSQRNKLNEYE